MRAGKIELGEADSGVQVLRLLGEHDLGTAAELRQAFNDTFARGKGIVVDLSAVEFIDSSIVAVFVECGRSEENETPSVAMYVPSEASASVRRVLELTGLGSHMNIVSSLGEARQAASGGG